MVDRSTAVIGDVPGRCVCVAVVAQDRPVQHDLLRPDATAAGECTRMQLPTSSSFHSTLQYTVTRKMPSSSIRRRHATGLTKFEIVAVACPSVLWELPSPKIGGRCGRFNITFNNRSRGRHQTHTSVMIISTKASADRLPTTH